MAKLNRVLIGAAWLVCGATACNNVVIIETRPPSECATVNDCAARAPVCGAAAACEEGACVFEVALESAPCNTGLLGVCAVGEQRCDAVGQPVSACVARAPEVERCDPEGLDEDCDGQVNEEGEGCVCGDGFVSKGEACDDGGTSDADSCSATCKDQNVLQVVAGILSTCVRLSGDIVKCWGDNYYGGLGLGDTAHRGDEPGEMGDKLPAVDLGKGRTAKVIAPGRGHTCALLSDGSVTCWGYNAYGQLGLGDTAHRGDGPGEMGDKLLPVNLGAGRTVQALAAGHTYTCALLDDDSVKCWGHNAYGQLGLGDKSSRGDVQGEMGDKLPAVNLGTGQRPKAITAGRGHTCALLSDGSVKCWGDNGAGQLGLGDTALRGDGQNEMGDKLPAVNLGKGRTAQAIAAGSFHTCALLDDGGVKCWGNNIAGELGLGDTALRGDGPDEMGDALTPIDLGKGRTARAITAGDAHTCALLDDDRVKCWGFNFHGQLGQGDTVSRGDGPGEMGDALASIDLGEGRTAQAITAGDRHSCALLDDGRAKCWGFNAVGQLGLGDKDLRGDGPDDMGDKLPAVKLFSEAW